MSRSAHLALGANLGDRLRVMRAAASRIGRLPETRIEAFSSLYETAPVGGPPGQPDYLNAVLRIETDRPPHDLLTGCLQIERDLGRERTVPDGPRTIDIDILLYDDMCADTADLVIPHPRLHARRFVLEPLAELDPELRHPRLNVTVGELLDRLTGAHDTAVRRVAGPGWPWTTCAETRHPHGP